MSNLVLISLLRYIKFTQSISPAANVLRAPLSIFQNLFESWTHYKIFKFNHIQRRDSFFIISIVFAFHSDAKYNYGYRYNGLDF